LEHKFWEEVSNPKDKVKIYKRRRKKITFRAAKRKPTKIRISFRTKTGKRVSFRSVKRKPKEININ